jgi:hypothetical protein
MLWTDMNSERPERVLALRRAATIVGGVAALAQRLNITERQLDYWMRDIGTLPDTVFFDVLDIIIQDAGNRVAELVEPRGRDGKPGHRDTFVQ